MLPIVGNPTRNFQAGQILAERMAVLERCPHNMDEFLEWCESAGLNRGGLEGVKSLAFWPQIIKKYSNLQKYQHCADPFTFIYTSFFFIFNV